MRRTTAGSVMNATIAICFTDLAVLLALRNVPPGALVLGHQKLGCRIVAAPHAQSRAS